MTTYTRRQFAKISAVGAATVALGAGSAFGEELELPEELLEEPVEPEEPVELEPEEALEPELELVEEEPLVEEPEPFGPYEREGEIELLANDRNADILLGVFTNSAYDSTDVFYMSTDGLHFEKISEAFVNVDKNSSSTEAVGSRAADSSGYVRSYRLFAFNCPSIMWHDGYFWMLANESDGRNDGGLRLVISASKDLIHWFDQKPVSVPLPSGHPTNGDSTTKFDAVAADWAPAPDGNIYVAVSLGYYGAYHGRAEQDTMTPYMAKITSLYVEGGYDPARGEARNSTIKIAVETPKPIKLPLADKNRIDGSWYFEGETAYLSIKRNGVTNEIWSIPLADIDSCGDASKWTKVNDNVVTGYEAPCLTKLGSTYYYFTDELATWTPDDHVRAAYLRNGTHMQKSSRLGSGWSEPARVDFYDCGGRTLTVAEKNNRFKDGPRHGTVIRVTDPAAKAVIWVARDNAGWLEDQIVSQRAFTDVSTSYWGREAVYFVNARGIMGGPGGGTRFQPDAPLTREMAITVLWRYLAPSDAYAADVNKRPNTYGFKDVKANQWYTGAVNWGKANNAMSGYPNGTFGIGKNITREEFCKILSLLAAGSAVETYESNALEGFPDRADVSGWAVPYVSWCIDNGIISGKSGKVAPRANLLRAEMATIVMRVIRNGIM